MSVTSPWPSIGRDLDSEYESEYLYHQGFDHDNLLKALMPPIEYEDSEGNMVNIEKKFYGPKSFNIFIAQKPYGWTNVSGDQWEFDWEAYKAELQDDLDRWQDCYDRFSSYKCLIWTDLYSAQKVVDANPQSKYLEMMTQTAAALSGLCDELEGFEYMGELSEKPEMNFFQEKIDEFFKAPAYKRH